MNEVHQWLTSLGLGQYADVFDRNAIDWSLLPKLDHELLKEMGIAAVGHRIRILSAARELYEQPSAPPALVSIEPWRASAPERRQLTVMFCDLVGSTALSRSMDPEGYRELLVAYQAAVRIPIEHHEGYIARYMGDGLLVYFGYPQAHEDDAERAVRAALGIVEAVSSLEPGKGIALHVRIGIATGLVVAGDIVGEGASEERAVLGDAPNLAARLQGLARPDEILVDETTQRLVGTAFHLVHLGATVLKGFEEPRPAWRAVSEGALDSRFKALHSGTLTQFVGREHELGLLLERWELAQGGEGQVVLLSGEAGIGKSRIVQALRDRVGDGHHFWVHCQCSPHHTNSAYHPFTRWLERAIGTAVGDSSAAKLDKLEHFLRPYADDLTNEAHLLATLLALPGESRYGPPERSSERRRNRTFEALAGQLLRRSASDPLLLVFEDAHWIDPTSEELLGDIVGRCLDAAVLVLIAHRPQYVASFARYPHVSSITLNRLSRTQSVELLRSAGGRALGDAVTERIIARADGFPLFIEELAKSVLEAAATDDANPELHIPETLHASLIARLDRLGAAKEVAQIGAAIGREYSIEVVTEVAGRAGLDVGTLHGDLLRSGMVFRVASSRGTTYAFKHALVQEAAYETMLKSRRAELHRQIAEVLEAQFPETVETSPETLARHYTEGNVPKLAISYWQRAGEMCVRTWANVEASNYFGRALGLLLQQPVTKERDAWEVRLRLASSGPLLMTKGHGAPEVEAAYSRARELSEALGDFSQLAPSLFGLWRHFVGRGNCHVTLQLGQELLDLSVHAKDIPNQVLGHYGLGYTLFCRGELEDARAHLEAGARLYERDQREALGFRLGQDPGVACLSYGALALWVLGHPDSAVRQSQEAVALADALAHPFSYAYALSLAAQVCQLYGDVGATLKLADKAISISRERGFAVWLASPTIFRGWATASSGETEAGINEMRNGINDIRVAGMEMRRPLYLCLLAEGEMAAGRLSEAKILIEETMAIMDRTGERWCEAEQNRLEGELLLHHDPDGAQAKFQIALEVARKQRARSWELRAAISLGRLWCSQGRPKEAASLIEPIYNGFTDGFESRDLRAAKALVLAA